MELVLVLPLILVLISCGHSSTEGTQKTSDLCYKLCPPGYHKVGTCDDQPVKKYKCERCEAGTYTEIENSRERCIKCDSCDHMEVEIKPCSFNSNTVCDCKNEFYNSGSGSLKECKKCSVNVFQRTPDYEKKCVTHKSTTMTTPSTVTSKSSTTASASPTPSSTASNSSVVSPTASTAASSSKGIFSAKSPNPKVDPVTDNSRNQAVLLAMIVVAILLLLLFVLIYIMNMLRYRKCFPCWSMTKEAGDPQNEQHSHRGPNTLAFTTCEETPMMPVNHSPAIAEHPTHISPLVPVSDHAATRHNDQSDQWPAIVLYAIIKEVPLNRWKEFLRLLSVADQQMERVELETGFGLGSMEKQYQMLRLWSQRSAAKLSDVFSALHYMDLNGCAQLLQESLERLQWRPEQ